MRRSFIDRAKRVRRCDGELARRVGAISKGSASPRNAAPIIDRWRFARAPSQSGSRAMRRCDPERQAHHSGSMRRSLIVRASCVPRHDRDSERCDGATFDARSCGPGRGADRPRFEFSPRGCDVAAEARRFNGRAARDGASIVPIASPSDRRDYFVASSCFCARARSRLERWPSGSESMSAMASVQAARAPLESLRASSRSPRSFSTRTLRGP